MAFKVDHENKVIIATSKNQTMDENIAISTLRANGYAFKAYKNKSTGKNKAYYLDKLNDEADKKEFERINKEQNFMAAKKWAEGKIKESKKEETEE